MNRVRFTGFMNTICVFQEELARAEEGIKVIQQQLKKNHDDLKQLMPQHEEHQQKRKECASAMRRCMVCRIILISIRNIFYNFIWI